MKCLSLFSSVTVAACLGLNALTPLAARDYDPSYRYEGQTPNRLRVTTDPYAAANETRVPWYEKLPELQAPAAQTVDAGQHHAEPTRLDATRWPEPNSNALRGSVTTSAYSPFSFARQQRDPIIGEVQPLPGPQPAMESMFQSPNSYPLQQDGWDVKQNFGAAHGWGDRAGNRFGIQNASCGKLWLAAADFYYLKRTTTSPVTILVDDTSRAIEEFNAQSLGFGHNVGYGFRLSRVIGCGTSINIGYFGLYDQQASAERTGDLALVLPGFASGGNPASYNSDYQSQLHSVELNIRQVVSSRFGLLAGIRYINLEDDLLISSQLGPVVTPQHYDIGVSNNLFGAQLGTDVFLARWGKLQVDALVKCGFYLNHASQTTSSALIGPSVSASHEAFAVVGSAGIFATYCVTDHWSLRGGYQVLGLHGIALAPEQLQQSNLATGQAGIDTTGSAFYSGASLGVQYCW